jgi:hypothetical protein
MCWLWENLWRAGRTDKKRTFKSTNDSISYMCVCAVFAPLHTCVVSMRSIYLSSSFGRSLRRTYSTYIIQLLALPSLHTVQLAPSKWHVLCIALHVLCIAFIAFFLSLFRSIPLPWYYSKYGCIDCGKVQYSIRRYSRCIQQSTGKANTQTNNIK